MPYQRSLLTRWGAISAAVVAAGACLALASSAQAASTLPTLSLAATASSITVSGSTQSGAVNVVSTATGVKEATVLVFLLKPGVSIAEVEAGQKSGGGRDPNTLGKYGSIVFVTEAEPGRSSEIQTILQPGQYVALIPSEGKGPKAKTPFTVTVNKAPASLPAPGATIRAIDFGFTGPTTLHVGEQVRFENEGFVVHMDVAFPVKNVKAAKKLVKLLKKPQSKAVEKQAQKLTAGAPFAFQGPVSSGAFQQETISAKPGVYVEACFMNTQDGREHTQLGMERIIKIVK